MTFAVNASTVFENIIDISMFMFTSKRTLYFRSWRLDEAAATVVLSGEEGGRPHSLTRQTSLNLAKGNKVVRAGLRLGGGIRW